MERRPGKPEFEDLMDDVRQPDLLRSLRVKLWSGGQRQRMGGAGPRLRRAQGVLLDEAHRLAEDFSVLRRCHLLGPDSLQKEAPGWRC